MINPNKKLVDLLYRCPLLAVEGQTDRVIHNLNVDSRMSLPNSVFVALRGTQADGHDHIQQALDHGASVIVCERWPEDINRDTLEVTWVLVSDSAKALGWIAANFYEDPSEELEVVGVTGTNGKTTVVTLLHQMALDLGMNAGLLSTVIVRFGDVSWEPKHTTLDAIELHKTLRAMCMDRCTHVFMEVSSHACIQQRIAGVKFRGGIFTNITHDHLDYHKTFANYLAAKKSFFDGLSSRAFALTNIDDKNGLVMTQNTHAKVRSYSLQQPANYRARVLEYNMDGSLLEWEGKEIWTQLVGRFNAANVTAVIGAALELGWDEEEVLLSASKLLPADGRFQVLAFEAGFHAVVDYAHTPDALKSVLETLHDVKSENGKILTVVGCGGNRDVDKRPKMGAIAAEASDRLWLTADNPRFEKADAIIEDMYSGIALADQSKVRREKDRETAITEAITACHPGDILLVAGKGHETYQIIDGHTFDFDDRLVLKKAYRNLYP